MITDDIRQIATNQKIMMRCLLASLVGVLVLVAGFVAAPDFAPLVILPVLVVLGIVGLVMTAFTFLLAIKVYNPGVGVVMGILTFIPYIGLIFLLIINRKATQILRGHGVQGRAAGREDLSRAPGGNDRRGYPAYSAHGFRWAYSLRRRCGAGRL